MSFVERWNACYLFGHWDRQQFLTFWLDCCLCKRNVNTYEARGRTLFRVSSHPFAPRQADSGGTLISRNEAHLHINKAVVGHRDGAREARMNHPVAPPLQPLLLPSLIPPSLDSQEPHPGLITLTDKAAWTEGSSGFYLLLSPSFSFPLAFPVFLLYDYLHDSLSAKLSLCLPFSSCLRSILSV